MKVVTHHGEYEVTPIKTEYSYNGRLAIELVEKDGFPFATLTVNIVPSVLDEMDDIPNDVAFVDINNCPWAEKFIRDNNLGRPTGVYGHSGFCVYPLYKFDLNKLQNI